MARPKGPDISIRLIDKIDKNANGCWIFRGASRRGYPVIWKEGKNVYAHRESYKCFCGTLSDEEVVCHKCDTPLCINPEHLFKGDRADNNKDMRDKIRHAYGEKAGRSKLTEEDVFFIKNSENSSYELSSILGVNPSTISRIRSGARWKHTIV